MTMPEEKEVQENVEMDPSQPRETNQGLSHIAMTIKNENNENSKIETVKAMSEGTLEDSYMSQKMKRSGRLVIFIACIGFLIIGRYSVPDNEVKCIQDQLIDGLGFANKFINTPGNEIFRDAFQFICSFLVDTVFLITFGYWVLYGKSGRLPMTLAVFYVTRAIVQKIWFSPFPQGFYWESPGIPSLVVPYGRGSDFFFSGHSGFLVICASEWHKLKMPRVRNFVIGVAVYTIMILMIYRIHYSIDIFTGVIFAEWCFGKVDSYKAHLDHYAAYFISKIRQLIDNKYAELPFIELESAHTQREQDPTKV